MPIMPTKLRVLLADDHPDILDEMRQLLTPEFEVVGSVAGGLALIEASRALRPDVVITDLNMPGVNGIEAGRQVLEQGLSPAVIILTVYNTPEMAHRAIEAGIRGYILKVDAGKELILAIEKVLAGHTYISRGMELDALS
jgi:DNA-binding NarL/FixJ family response regulator